MPACEDPGHGVEGGEIRAHFETPLIVALREVLSQIARRLGLGLAAERFESKDQRAPVRILRDACQHARGSRGETEGRVRGLDLDGGLGGERPDEILRERIEEGFPVGEVVVEGAVRDFGLGDHVADRQSLALLGQGPEGRGDQLGSRSLPFLVPAGSGFGDRVHGQRVR